MKDNKVNLLTGNPDDATRNGSGYKDTTAFEAIKNVDAEAEVTAESWRFHELLDTIRSICELADFEIENRIVFKDKRTGKVWR